MQLPMPKIAKFWLACVLWLIGLMVMPVGVSSAALSPIYREMKAALQARDYLQVDETPIRYLDPDVKGKSQQGWLWTYGHPREDVVFDWNGKRGQPIYWCILGLTVNWCSGNLPLQERDASNCDAGGFRGRQLHQL
jgi:Transposase IS66 family